MSSLPYPVALVGLGRIAWRLEDDPKREKPATHVGAILAEPRLALCAGVDVDANARQEFTGRFGVPTYTDFQAMVAAHQPVIVAIATHPDSHAYYLGLCVESGIPVVICEKPLGLVSQDFRSLLGRAERAGIRVMVNHERRYSRDWQRAGEILRSCQLGSPVSFAARVAMGRRRPAREVLFWDGTHMLDALRFLFGGRWQVLWASQLSRPQSQIHALLRVGGVVGSLEVEAGCDHLVFELEVRTERGRLRVGNGVWEVWESQDSPYYQGFRSLVRIEEGPLPRTEYFAGVYREAADCLQTPTRLPLSSGWDGWEALCMIRSILNATRRPQRAR